MRRALLAPIHAAAATWALARFIADDEIGHYWRERNDHERRNTGERP